MATRTRKKKEAPPPEPAAFVVGEPEVSASAEERPEVSEETVSGLLALDGHLTQRVPTGLMWPLHRSLPSMQQYLSDLDSADEAVNKLAVRHALSTDKMRELSDWLLRDAYAFGYLICNHRRLLPEVHMAMCYSAAGQAQKLAWLITQSGFEGFIIDHFRSACRSHGIDPTTAEGVERLDKKLDWQNQRWSRGWYKSSTISHTGAVITGTLDPNRTILLVCAKEDKAFEIVEQAGETLKSGIYQDFFPHRVPAKARDISKSEGITFGGRTVSARERTFQGASYISREIGGHHSDIYTDDLVIRDPRGGIIGGGEGGPAIRWLHGMPGLRILGQRFRRRHLGTINDMLDDDHAWLTYGARQRNIISIVVPSETFPEGKFPSSVMERGTPTAPTFFGVEAITEALEGCLADETEIDGVEAFRSDYWLSPISQKSRMFEKEIVNDPDRIWLGPYEHPKSRLRHKEHIDYTKRFMVGKYARDERRRPLSKKDRKTPIDVPDWKPLAHIDVFDPWADMDTVVTLNTTWNDGGKRWALTVAAIAHDMTKLQLETRTGSGGVDEWAGALVAVNELYEPRAIGIDKKAFTDPIIQNRMQKTDTKLRALRSKCVGVDISDSIEESRIRAGVAEPLRNYQLLLLASGDPEKDYGATHTRREMIRYRPGSDETWPILESLAMIDAVARKPLTKEEREKIRTSRVTAQNDYARRINPYTGVAA